MHQCNNDVKFIKCYENKDVITNSSKNTPQKYTRKNKFHVHLYKYDINTDVLFKLKLL